MTEFEGRATQDFTVPETLDEYAPEVVYLNATAVPDGHGAPGNLARVSELQTLIVALPADAILEIDLLQPGQGAGGTWREAVRTYGTVGLKDVESFGRWLGVRLRFKSGGTAGTATVDASWWG